MHRDVCLLQKGTLSNDKKTFTEISEQCQRVKTGKIGTEKKLPEPAKGNPSARTSGPNGHHSESMQGEGLKDLSRHPPLI